MDNDDDWPDDSVDPAEVDQIFATSFDLSS